MKRLARGRARPSPPSPDGHTPKNLSRAVDIRRWRAFRAWFHDHVSREAQTETLLLIARSKGHNNAGMARHILHGHEAINTDWMLHVARHFDVAPQRIWTSDWPYSDLTPDIKDSGLHEVLRCWSALNVAERHQILSIASPSVSFPRVVARLSERS